MDLSIATLDGVPSISHASLVKREKIVWIQTIANLSVFLPYFSKKLKKYKNKNNSNKWFSMTFL